MELPKPVLELNEVKVRLYHLFSNNLKQKEKYFNTNTGIRDASVLICAGSLTRKLPELEFKGP
jgi:hypothetical protein